MNNISLNKNIRLILGSSSQRRKDILKSLGLPYVSRSPNIIESRKKNETPLNFVKRISKEKSVAVWESLEKSLKENTLLLTSDTIVTLKSNGKYKVFGKPLNPKNAEKTLRALSGRKHFVITAFTLKTRKKSVTKSVKTAVKFRKLSEIEIRAYANLSESHDKAGAYAIQGKGSFFVSKIEGSFSNVIGLPIEEFLQEFAKI